jgi:hypothetical protein
MQNSSEMAGAEIVPDEASLYATSLRPVSG